MANFGKQWLSVLVALSLLIGTMPVLAFAGNDEGAAPEEPPAAARAEEAGSEAAGADRPGAAQQPDPAPEDSGLPDSRTEAAGDGEDEATGTDDLEPGEDGGDEGVVPPGENAASSPSAGEPAGGDEDEAVVITAPDARGARGDRTFDLLDGVSARDGGARYAVAIGHAGGFDVNQIGDYRVTYVTDDPALGRVYTAAHTVTVEEAQLERPASVYDPQPGLAEAVRELAEGHAPDADALPRWERAVDTGWPPTVEVFAGWRQDDAGRSRYPYNYVAVGDRDLLMVARYAPSNQAMLPTYHANNDTGVRVASHVEAGEPAELMGAGVFLLPGYEQVGWSLAPDGDVDHRFGEALVLRADTDLYAAWEGDGIYHTVRFEANGGTAVPDQLVNNHGRAARPAAPVREGHGFAGWYADAGLTALYDFDAPVTADITLHARWAEDSGDGGGSGGDQSGGARRGSDGIPAAVTIPDAEIPLGSLVEIVDGDLPLGALPQTGKSDRRSGPLLGAVVLLLGSLGLVALTGRDGEDI